MQGRLSQEQEHWAAGGGAAEERMVGLGVGQTEDSRREATL